MREMIMSETTEERIEALERLLPMQREDFVGLFEEMKGLSRHDSSFRSAATRISTSRRRRNC